MFADLLRRTIADIPTPVPSVPEGQMTELPSEDTEEGIEKNSSDGFGSALFIHYKNSKSEISKRRITLKKIYRGDNNQIMIGGYCFERKAYRTFRADRIIEAIDLATGETLDNEQKIIECFGLITDDNKNNPKMITQSLLRKCRHSLNILIYLARCDGHYQHDEEAIIIHYIMNEFFDYTIDDQYLNERIRGIFPDTDTFFDSLDFLEKNDQRSLNKIAKYAAQLIQADGEIAFVETKFMNELNSYLSSQ